MRPTLFRDQGKAWTWRPWLLKCLGLCSRYLQDLPQGLSTFNDTCIAQQKDHPMVHQNKEHVRSIVQVCTAYQSCTPVQRQTKQLFED